MSNDRYLDLIDASVAQATDGSVPLTPAPEAFRVTPEAHNARSGGR